MASNANEARKRLIEKYRPTLAAMAKVGEDGDMGVLFDKLMYMHRVKRGEIPPENADVYKGIPEDFDHDAFDEDLKTLE